MKLPGKKLIHYTGLIKQVTDLDKRGKVPFLLSFINKQFEPH